MKKNKFALITIYISISFIIVYAFFLVLNKTDLIPNQVVVKKVHLLNIYLALSIFTYTAHYSFQKTKNIISINSIDLLVVVYLSYVITSYIRQVNNYNEYILIFIVSWLFVFLIKHSSINNTYRTIILFFFLTIIIWGLYEALYGQLQLLGYRQSNNSLFPITGSFHNPGPFAIFLSSIFPVCLAIYLFPLHLSQIYLFINKLGILTMIVIIIVIPSTQSRSAWLSIVTGTIFLLFVRNKCLLSSYYHQIKIRIKRFLAIFLLAITASIGYLLYQYKPDSASGRLLVWRSSLHGVMNNPIFGIGYGQFRYQFGNMNSEFVQNNITIRGESKDSADHVYYAFNDFLQILVENGIVGFAIFMILIFFCFRFGLRKIHNQKSPFLLGALAGILSLLTAACFSYPFEMAPTWLLFTFFIAVISVESNSKTLFTFGIPKAVSLLLLTFMGWLLIQEYYLIENKKKWQTADMLFSSGHLRESISLYEMIYQDLQGHPEILLGYGKALYQAGNYQKSVQILELAATQMADPFLFSNLGDAYLQLAKFDQSEKSYKKSISINPKKMYPRYLLAKMYLAKGDTLKAKETAKYIVSMPVPVPSPAIEEMTQEMEKILL